MSKVLYKSSLKTYKSKVLQQTTKLMLLFASDANKLGDNCIQNFNLGRYIVGYTVGNSVLRRSLPKIKILSMVIPILMHFYIFDSKWSIASRVKQHVIQLNVT